MKSITLKVDEAKTLFEAGIVEIVRANGLEDVNSYSGLLIGSSIVGSLGYRGFLPSDGWLSPSAKKQFKKEPGAFHLFIGAQPGIREVNPIPVHCPYGYPGEVRWMREPWAAYTCGHSRQKTVELGWKFSKWIEEPQAVRQRSTGIKELVGDIAVLYQADGIAPWHGNWNSPIYMPRWASRFTVQIDSVRVDEQSSFGNYAWKIMLFRREQP